MQTSPLAPSLGPVQESARILSLDALRGFALLGIFMVNMQLFAMPLTYFLAPQLELQGAPQREVAAWWLVEVFFEFKFISIFSLLFGAGLIMQMMRAAQRDRPFVGLYLRRLAVLALIGLCHGLLLWYGDILFVYSITGTILLFCRNFRPRTLLLCAVGIVGFFTLLNLGIMVLMMLLGGSLFPQATVEQDAAVVQDTAVVVDLASGEPATSDDVTTRSIEDGQATGSDAQEPSAASDVSPTVARWFPWLPVMMEVGLDPQTPAWAQAEITAYRQGPFLMAEGFRAAAFLMAVFAAISYGWQVLAMFFIGAALMKVGFFTTARRVWRRRMCLWGLLLGVPLELLGASVALKALDVENQFDLSAITFFRTALQQPGSVLMCLGLVGGVTLLVEAGRLRVVLKLLQNAGRMALSNYLLQTVVATWIMYWWGLAYFGSVSRVTQIGLVVLIFVGQLVLSTLWLRLFSMGPIEWAWRCLTYLRIQPIVRRQSRS